MQKEGIRSSFCLLHFSLFIFQFPVLSVSSVPLWLKKVLEFADDFVEDVAGMHAAGDGLVRQADAVQDYVFG